MFILDTNVISEAMRRRNRNPNVIKWLGSTPDHQIYTTAISKAELLAGIAILKDPAQHRNLKSAINNLFNSTLSGRVLPFTETTTEAYAKVAQSRYRRFGQFSQPDMMIAAIAVEHGMVVASGNVRDFEGSGAEMFNPFR